MTLAGDLLVIGRMNPGGRGHSQRGFLALALGFLLVDFLLINLGRNLHIPGTYWNWGGKFTSLAFCGALLAGSPWLRQNVGLRWKQAPGSVGVSVACFLVCTATGAVQGFCSSALPFSGETLLFEALMPSLDEELAVRGIALAWLERAFGESPMSGRLRYGWAALVTSVFFGLAHSVGVSQGLHFSALAFGLTFGFASVAALARTRSGSLLWPVLCHSGWNVSSFLLRMALA